VTSVIIGALTFIKQDEKIPARSLVAGNPGKIIKQVTDEMLAWKTEGTKLYQSLPKEMFEGWKECEPLREIPDHIPLPAKDYKPFSK
jgi:carbonic anhydrase/acetyltransferase-like protein (isoleucine patch superfamily)